MTSSDSDEVIISYGDAAIRPSDLDTLKPDEWINDSIITFIYEVINRHVGKKVGLWPPSVVELLSNLPDGQDGVESMLPPMKDFMVLPISDRYGNPDGTGSHWSCLCCTDGKAIHLDSLSPANNESAKLVFNKLSEVPNLQANKFTEGECPVQANASDCGLYAILIPYSYFMDDKCKQLEDAVESLTPERVAAFREALYDWLNKWANLSDKEKDSIHSHKDIIKTVGQLN
ncbi:cysteine proteinase [Meira miltonrushii]|uniref:Cysteine proteinase n=1 Tax=Meira miltonrushii TaxID=1280837 RepID=A0A316V6T0_9BASI|nr:cysteine proteinase [Meira miltonrushii]PWN33240.1 cysteine proteinase [Meira miltonrushii]